MKTPKNHLATCREAVKDVENDLASSKNANKNLLEQLDQKEKTIGLQNSKI